MDLAYMGLIIGAYIYVFAEGRSLREKVVALREEMRSCLDARDKEYDKKMDEVKKAIQNMQIEMSTRLTRIETLLEGKGDK